MKLYEWNIWHTFSTFLPSTAIDLDVSAVRIIKSGLANAVMLSTGRVYWTCEDEIHDGEVSIRFDPDGMKADISWPSETHEKPYVFEGLFQSAVLRYAELKLFGQNSPLPSPYLRILMPECRLHSADFAVKVYPIVKLHETGIILVELRMISPDKAVDLEDFINHYVNASLLPYDSADVPVSLARIAPIAYHNRGKPPLRDRIRFAKKESGHKRAIKEHSYEDHEGEFQFAFAPLGKEGKQPESFVELALTIVNSTAYVISKPRSAAGFIVFGQRQILDVAGGWIGRPHVHIIRHSGQRISASANERTNRDAFGWILARTIGTDLKVGRTFLPPSARPFDDYGVYINSAASLYVQAKKGLKKTAGVPWADPNLGHFVYEHQVKSEMLDYGYMVYRRMAGVAAGIQSLDSVLSARRNFSEFESALIGCGRFGEIRDLLQDGWNAIGLDRIRRQITEAFSVGEAEATIRERRLWNRLGFAVSIILGVSAVPRLAREVLRPLWSHYGWPLPPSADAAELVLVAVSAGLMTVAVGSLYWWVTRKRERLW